MKRCTIASRMRVVAPALIAATLASPALAQQVRSLSPAYRLNGRQVTRVIEDAAAPVRAATVTVVAQGKPTTLGLAVAKDLVITKASEVTEPIGLTTHENRSFRAQIVASDAETDLVLIRVSGAELTPVTWGPIPEPSMGQFVATVWPDSQRLRLGVVAAQSRAIERSGGVLGIGLGRDGEGFGGVEVNQVYPNSGAAAAGLKVRDVVVAIDGHPTPRRETLIETVTRRDPGDILKVTIARGAEQLTLNVTLGHRSAIFDLFDRNQRMSGKTSKRRAGFERVIQHDAPVGPEAMGSALVDLDGRIVGVNIARVDRVATYALPADVVQRAIARMSKQAEEPPMKVDNPPEADKPADTPVSD